jgi:hypothetical protein
MSQVLPQPLPLDAGFQFFKRIVAALVAATRAQWVEIVTGNRQRVLANRH